MKSKLFKIVTAVVEVGAFFWILSVLNCIIQIIVAGFMIYSGILGWFGGIVWWLVGTFVVDFLLIIHVMRMIDKRIEK